MKIHIDRRTYKKLSDDDKIRFLIICTDTNFKKKIDEERNELKAIYGLNWQNYLKGRYNKNPLLIPLDDKEIKKLLKKEKIISSIQKAVRKKARIIIDKLSYLDGRWQLLVENLICENKEPFFPSNYSIGEIEGQPCIYINNVTTKNDLIEWIEKNWRLIQATYRISSTLFSPQKRKKKYLPDFENLQKAIEIIDLKDNKGNTFQQVLEKVFSDEYKICTTDTKRVENIYFRIKKEIKKFTKEQESTKKLINNLKLS